MGSIIKVYCVSDLLSAGKRSKDEIIDGFVKVNEAVWGDLVSNEYVWTHEKMEQQIKNCPHLLYCAYVDGTMAGTLSCIYKNRADILNCRSWDDMSGQGTLSTHDENGDSSFGIDLSVIKEYQNLGVPYKIMRKGFFERIVMPNKKGAYLGSRIPGYKAYKEKHANMDIEEYVFGHKNEGRTHDPEIRIYQGEGFQRVQIVKDYFKDEESLDYGVLMFWENKYHLDLKKFYHELNPFKKTGIVGTAPT